MQRERQTFPASIIKDGQDAELAPIMGATFDEAVGPHMPWILRPQANARSVVEPQASPFGLALRHLESFAPPDPLNPLMVYRPSCIAQQRRHPAVIFASSAK